MCPARDHFIFLTLLITSMTFPLPDPDVGPSVLACNVEHTSYHFGLCKLDTAVACAFTDIFGTGYPIPVTVGYPGTRK